MKRYFKKLLVILPILVATTSCQNYDQLLPNPNVASESNTIPPEYLLGRITYDMYAGGGVVDGRPGNVSEQPFDQAHRWNQFIVSNNLYYGGKNTYDWSVTATPYGMLKNAIKMEEQALKTLGTKTNAYAAVAKFVRAYTAVWLTQRLGDVPMSEAGQGLENLTPKYDAQKDVYISALQLLEDANADFTSLIANSTQASILAGDILLGNDIKKWQKAVNTYKLRVLISLSKRADDTPELGIKQKFADIVNNPTKYPVMGSNADNMVFTFNSAYNTYPHTPKDGNNNYQNIGSAYLKLTTVNADPRTFIVATPAPAELAKGKTVSDFSAYVGSDISDAVADLFTNSTAGKYSFTNFNRYYGSVVGPEPYIIMGYSEMNFNIAEGINRGWATGDAAAYYTKGINASLAFYGLSEGATLTIGDLTGKTLGNVNVSIANFLTNPNVVYKGNNTTGLEQILNQKYISFFQNSGWEAFYNQRRTGYPKTFITVGSGINSVGKVPLRWLYPVDESTYNPENYTKALTQFGGKDDIYAPMWLLK
ncbi:SusD/RagB family nutrient-binding outer membrane lipoprotein [Arcicella aquatica]|uniref:SusD/RagB family nutrient-binding outer membrane lipoprotein n=1 Tax=Arcicella aquatica TaxID=217141 RepID=A0ABU5QQL8_9BACT|nr:SusD/RagB family nutrient-binding outer membrane lipoprotein [Arcicella aquatica]MEA5259376.1 SusD/RagB family nutrient-binding outer membrane lipoprotein [Arcicella aquatica]